MIETYINNQIKNIKRYIKKMYRIDVCSFREFNNFAYQTITSILSFKIWLDKLRHQNASMYIGEIISSLNQVLILSAIGFKIPSYLMLRRCYENILNFNYYKEHTVEFYNALNELDKKEQKELRKYITEYPFEMIYKDVDCDLLNNFCKDVIGKEYKPDYAKLSKFVHNSPKEFDDTNVEFFIENIQPKNEFIVEILPMISRFCSISNTIFLLFHFNIYKEFAYEQKTVIRLGIADDMKKKLIEIFKEI